MAFEILPQAEKDRRLAVYQAHARRVIDHLAQKGPPEVRKALEEWDPTAYAIEQEHRRLKAMAAEAAALPGWCANRAEKAARERGQREAREYRARERQRYLEQLGRQNRDQRGK